MYDYKNEIKNSIYDALNESDTQLNEHNFEEVYDELFIDDSVTGNASGSFTFNSSRAHEFVKDNLELACEAFEEFGEIDALTKALRDREWELIDVTIRCFLLYGSLEEVLQETAEELA